MISEDERNSDIKEPDYFSKQIHQAKRFYRITEDHNSVSGPGFQVVAGGRETCFSGYFVSRKTFPYHTIEFITRGHGKLILKGVIWELSPGWSFLLRSRYPP